MDEFRGVHPPKRMMHIAYSPHFHKIYKFLLYFHKIYTFPPISTKFTFLGLIYVFCFPYFDHDAFMHHTLHILDAPGRITSENHPILLWHIWTLVRHLLKNTATSP